MTDYRFSNIAAACFCLFFLRLPFSSGQDVLTTPATQNASETEPTEKLEIKISVNEVRLDVVVLDKKGNPVTDLTADDFEVYQDNKKQDILSSIYVNYLSDTTVQTAISRKGSRNLPLLPGPSLKKEDIRRTIIFVVDDLAFTFSDGYNAKMALRNFVEKQMQPGDLVAIIRTGYGNSALQMFLSDKLELVARIDAMRMEMLSAIQDPSDADLFRIYDNQLSTLSYSFRALKNMPGRKILNMMTGLPRLIKPNPFEYPPRPDFDEIYGGRFSKLSDEALRAGVVVNYLDIRGLTGFIGRGSITHDASLSAIATINNLNQSIWYKRFESERGPSPSNPLPAKTGGVFIQDSNFFLYGIDKEAESLMKGYYLVSYEPPSDTLELDGREKYHNIRVRVKRSGAKVYTRDGFFSRIIESEISGDIPENPLIDAIFSPFLYAGLNVNMAAGYVKNANSGYLIHSWIHLNPKDVNIIETEDGGALIDIETMCLTSDINGYVQDVRHVKFAFTIKPENKSQNIEWIEKHGIRFSMLLPVKKPGNYYFRTSVRDNVSNKVGSAYQFVDIPDLKKKGLALSNIFMITSLEDLQWMNSDATKEINEGVFSSVFQAEEVRSPALRTYEHGDKLQMLAILYNVDRKAAGSPEIEIQTVLYKDGKEFRRGAQVPISVEGAENVDGIPILQRFTLGTDMSPGDYLLELTVTDKKNSRSKEGIASQTLGFTVAEKPICDTVDNVCVK